MEFITDPGTIETKSMEIIKNLLGPLNLNEVEKKVVYRVVHTAGDPKMAPLVKFSPKATETGVEAFRNGAALITDVRMLTAGVSKKVLNRLGCELQCAMEVSEMNPPPKGITRAMWGIEQLSERINGAVIAIGNAPTALIKLLQMLEEDRVRPSLIVGTPVGFVGAKESKEYLMEKEIDYITITGNRGGSTIAASIINALLYAV